MSFPPIAGDEVIVIQGKLEGIKSRYAEIDMMSSSVSRSLEQALSLAAKLQHTHQKLSVWLDGLEAELKGFGVQDLRGEQLTQTQERQKVCSSAGWCFPLTGLSGVSHHVDWCAVVDCDHI